MCVTIVVHLKSHTLKSYIYTEVHSAKPVETWTSSDTFRLTIELCAHLAGIRRACRAAVRRSRHGMQDHRQWEANKRLSLQTKHRQLKQITVIRY